MKKILFIVAVTMSVTMFAQKQINEGMVVSKQTMSSDNEQMNAQLAMLGDMTTVTYFKDEKSRSELSNPMTGNTVFIADNNSKKSLVLLDNAMIGKKYMESDISPTDEDLENISIEKTNETKTILGYECTKYNIVMNKDGAEVKMEVYATDKLKAISQQATTFGKEFSGFPMYMAMAIDQQGVKMNMVIEVTEVKEQSVSADKFSMTPPEGYSKTDNIPGM